MLFLTALTVMTFYYSLAGQALSKGKLLVELKRKDLSQRFKIIDFIGGGDRNRTDE